MQAPAPPAGYQSNLSALYTQNAAAKPMKKTIRVLPQQPERVLDALSCWTTTTSTSWTGVATTRWVASEACSPHTSSAASTTSPKQCARPVPWATSV